MGLLRAVPMLGPLAGPVIERLAGGAEHLSFEPDEVIIREGDPGDRFYVVATGRVRVSAHGRDAGLLGPGEGFGEIALLRDVPRTATFVASEGTDIVALARDVFLEALTGQPRSRAMATEVVQDHLRADVGS